jgi:DNA-binding protein H-NS
MANVNYEKMNLKQLLNHEVRVKRAIAAVRDRSRSEARHKVDAVLKEMGFSLKDIYGGRGGRGGKVAPKYRNPDDPSETWTGRGRQPRWLVAKIKRGSKVDDFRI